MSIFTRKPMARTASCSALTNANSAAARKTPPLKRCATTARAVYTTGWGIMPVLSELERRSSRQDLLVQRSPSSNQLLCRNCRRLFFRTPEYPDHVNEKEGFCSLDCKSSHECHLLVQERVDLEIHSKWSCCSESSDDDGIITLVDDAELSFS